MRLKAVLYHRSPAARHASWGRSCVARMHEHATLKVMRLRRSTVERPFAELKDRHMGRRFLLRGLDGTRCEMA
ncbi:transposase [Dyella sp.]|uniref:transposase n=1 Tax=Dyella sp. TaxID=1869338 RepID=UPI0039C89DC0